MLFLFLCLPLVPVCLYSLNAAGVCPYCPRCPYSGGLCGRCTPSAGCFSLLRCNSVLCAAFRIFATCRYIGIYLQAAVGGCPYLEVIIFRPFSIRRGRPFLCVVYSLNAAGVCPCCLYLSVSGSVSFSSVEALPSLSVSFISGGRESCTPSAGRLSIYSPIRGGWWLWCPL